MPTLLRASLLALAIPLLGAACEPDKPQGPVPCRGEGGPCIEPGHTTAALCEAGVCLGANDSCETHADCFLRIEPGDDIPAWSRPQGGVGTRLNARFEGVDVAKVRFLETLVTGRVQLEDPNDPASTIPCSPDACPDGACPCDEEAGFSCVQYPNGESLCAELICRQVNQRFPLDEHPFGALVTTELPIRFVNEIGLEALDDREVDLTMAVAVGENADNAEMLHATVPVVLRVGAFVEPSWWDQ